jgi:hypothetical protein
MSTSSLLQEARDWSRELFESHPGLSVVLVLYNPWAKQRTGRKHKPGVVSIQRDVIAALKNGNIERAKQLAVSVSPDSGLALCDNQEALSEVLAERIRRREYCYVDDDLHASALMLTVWRE